MILIFVATAVVAALLIRTDWLMVALGPYFPVYWAAVLAWVACVIGAIRRQRRWWVLATGLVVLYPAARMAGFLVECSQKACIF
ncbi:hypothetical protein A9974_06845 [Achromobacter sp. UMC71]|nr:hypothetical protein [Achromobacter sp. UMC71]